MRIPFLLIAAPAILLALPQGVEIALGDAALRRIDENQLEIAVSERAALDWESFSIDAGESVSFAQPSASSCVLNRVLGEDPSQILGELRSNGECILVNPRGIVFGKDSRIDVHSLIASSFDLHHSLFEKNRDEWRFEGAAADVFCSGNIQAKGHVYLLGGRVGLFDEARIAAPSGKVLIGGDFQGNNPLIPSAQQVYFSAHATIDVDALESGNGGTIVLWSEAQTQSYGTLSARGGRVEGDGGFIEVSCPNRLDFQSQAATLAPNGKTGTLLLDPLDLTIEGADALITIALPFVTPMAGSACAPGPGHATISTATLDGLLGGSNVTLQTTGTVGACPGNIIWEEGFPLTYMSPNTLTFDSANDVSIFSEVINNDTGDISILAAGAVFIGRAANATISRLETAGGGDVDVQCVSGLTVTAGIPGPANSGITAVGALTINVSNGNLLLDSATNADNTGLSGNPVIITVPQGAIDVLSDTSGTTGIGFTGDSFMNIVARDTITYFSGNSGRNQNGGVTASGFPSLIESLTGDILCLNPSGQRLWFINGLPLTFRAARDFIFDVSGADNRLRTTSFPVTIEAGRDISFQITGGLQFLGSGLFATAGRDIFFELEPAGAMFAIFGTDGMFWNAASQFTIQQSSAILPLAISSSGPVSITSGSNTNFFVNSPMDLVYISSSSTFSVQSGGNINYSSTSTGIVNTIGDQGHFLDSRANINLFDLATVRSNGTDILLIADSNIRMNATSSIDFSAPLIPGSTVTLVVDNAFPAAPLIGPGMFFMENGAVIMSMERPPIAIYTALQNLNLIAGSINGAFFSPGTLFLDTNEEQWCTYYPDGANVLPFRVHYKNCLQAVAQQAMLSVVEFLDDLHPYDEFPGWFDEFSLLWKSKDDIGPEPYFIRRRQLDVLNQPKTYTNWLHSVIK
jgi:filamentous hemagglutinin family protein